MKKTLIACAAFAAALTMGALQASAFCITLGDFCDRMEVSATSGLLFGRWDADCEGGLTVVSGTVGFGSADVNGSIPATPGVAWIYAFNLSTMTWSNFYTDGFTITPFNLNLPFSYTPGVCPLSGGGGTPSTAR